MESTIRLLGMRIKEIRQSRKMSQDKLSEKLGIDPKYLSRIEVGKATPSLDLLMKTAGFLDIDLKELFEFTHFEKAAEKNHIEMLLKRLSEEQRKLVIKLIKAVTN